MKGGKRSGAGRPKGSPNKNQAVLREYAQKVAAGEGLDSPLETMLATMRHLYALAVKHDRDKTVLIEGEGDNAKFYTPIQLWLMTAEAAARAAPFVHPKLANVEANVTAKMAVYEASLLELAKDEAG